MSSCEGSHEAEQVARRDAPGGAASLATHLAFDSSTPHVSTCLAQAKAPGGVTGWRMRFSSGADARAQAMQLWASWTELDTRCALPRAVLLHSQRYIEQTRELYGRVGLAREMRRTRIGRPLERWKDALAAWGQDWVGRARDPNAIVDVVANVTAI